MLNLNLALALAVTLGVGESSLSADLASRPTQVSDADWHAALDLSRPSLAAMAAAVARGDSAAAGLPARGLWRPGGRPALPETDTQRPHGLRCGLV